MTFSANQEREADYIAAYILARSDFNLVAAREMMLKLGAVGEDDGFLSSFSLTHPAGPERLATWDATTNEVAASSSLTPVAKD